MQAGRAASLLTKGWRLSYRGHVFELASTSFFPRNLLTRTLPSISAVANHSSLSSPSPLVSKSCLQYRSIYPSSLRETRWLLLRSFSTSKGEEELKWHDVDTPELVDLLQGGEPLYLIDVREPEELKDIGVLPHAVNVPLGEVEEAFSLSPDKFKEKYNADMPSKTEENILFSCMRGIRSLNAMETAHRLGFSKARNYVRGYVGWEDYMSKQPNPPKID